MKIVFFGTSPFGLPALEALSKSRHTISLIVTTQDKPQGRDLKILPSPVKEWAQAQGIPVIETSRDQITSLAASLKKLNADVFVVISFGVILPRAILDIPAKACLNVHSSLLPKYRGPAPIHWAILNGDTQSGVTVMRMALTLDTGDILEQATLPILPQEDEPSLHRRLSELGAQVLLEGLDRIEKGKPAYVPQEESLASYARKITKEDGRIQWNAPVEEIANKVRALAAWPKAFTFLKTKRVILYRVSVYPAARMPRAVPGQVLSVLEPDGLLVMAQNGVLKIEELQMEGRNRVLAAQFVSGKLIQPGDILE